MTSQEKTYCVYFLASKPHGVLYVGFTSQLATRMTQHRNGEVEGFTKRYHVHHLVYYKTVDNPISGIQREKQLKKWNRAWKVRLIERHNPSWKDLFNDGEILSLPIE